MVREKRGTQAQIYFKVKSQIEAEERLDAMTISEKSVVSNMDILNKNPHPRDCLRIHLVLGIEFGTQLKNFRYRNLFFQIVKSPSKA